MTHGLRTKVSRPVTVWVAQALLLIFAAIWLFALTINLIVTVRDGSSASPIRMLVGASILCSIVVVLLIAFWGLAKRRMYGKWVSVVALSFLWLVFVYLQVYPPAGPVHRFEYNSSAEVAGAVITALLISVLFLLVIFRLAFSKKVDGFFRQ